MPFAGNIGIGEIAIVLVIALIVIGPKKLPDAANSALKYVMDPKEQLKIYTAIEDAGLDLGAIYHSHTRSDPIPSQTDVNLARLGDSDQPAFPGTLYLIFGVKGD